MQVWILKVVRDCTEIVQNPPDLGTATGQF